ncbi:MAG TPA: VOC family protein [Burkholderiaceae bacterium]|nr:VOC family protein [Burkholderiaceae bacterium]
MNDPYDRPPVAVSVYYRDPFAALDWLERAFGFQRVMVITDPDGKLAHSEMRIGDSGRGSGLIYVGPEWADHVASPATVGGKNTQSIHVHLSGDLDAHCAHARAAGAVVVREPAEQFYGDRVYAARDPEGHVWTFSRPVRMVTREEAERTSGLKIDGWPTPSG